jgi:uncharacterized membrane protein
MAEEKASPSQGGQQEGDGGSSEGIDPKLAALLGYIWIIGVVFLLISKDKFVKFHALQSIFLGIAWFVIALILSFVPVVNFFSWLLWPLYVVLIVVMMVKAYNGEKYKLPVIGDLAEKNS